MHVERRKECFFVAVFSVEFFGRFWSTDQTTWQFLKSFLNIIDFLSIAPFYIYVIYGSSAPVSMYVLRMIRLFRLIQMFKLARYSKTMFVIVKSIGETKEALNLMASLEMPIACFPHPDLMRMWSHFFRTPVVHPLPPCLPLSRYCDRSVHAGTTIYFTTNG